MPWDEEDYYTESELGQAWYEASLEGEMEPFWEEYLNPFFSEGQTFDDFWGEYEEFFNPLEWDEAQASRLGRAETIGMQNYIDSLQMSDLNRGKTGFAGGGIGPSGTTDWETYVSGVEDIRGEHEQGIYGMYQDLGGDISSIIETLLGQEAFIGEGDTDGEFQEQCCYNWNGEEYSCGHSQCIPGVECHDCVT